MRKRYCFWRWYAEEILLLVGGHGRVIAFGGDFRERVVILRNSEQKSSVSVYITNPPC